MGQVSGRRYAVQLARCIAIVSEETELKLSAACTRLILDKPFLGALVLRLPMYEADAKWCPTTATDARAFYYNPQYIDALDVEQTQFVLAHEALHCALSHFMRREHRIKARWDLACDFAINPLLVKDNLKPPPGVMIMAQYADMTAEEIYPLIEEADQQTMDRHLYDDLNDEGKNDAGSSGASPPQQEPQQEPQQQTPKSEQQGNKPRTQQAKQGQDKGGAQPPPLSDQEREQLGVQWRQRLAGAAQQAMQAGKMDAAMARMVDHLLQPVLPWRMLLARYMSATGRDDYSYVRPSRREGTALFPSLRSSQVDVVVVVDTSGSISDQEIEEFISEVNVIKAQVRARITLHACDDHLSEDGPWIYEPWDDFSAPVTISGGGGTRFVPAFDWIAQQGMRPDLLVYFTDAEGRFPEQEPDFPVIWLVKGKSTVPWGQRIQLN